MNNLTLVMIILTLVMNKVSLFWIIVSYVWINLPCCEVKGGSFKVMRQA